MLAGVFVLASFIAPAGSAFGEPLPKGWVLVDADTGRVIASGGARVALPPASLSKVLTALVVVSSLKADAPVVVSGRAAGAPASRLGLRRGETWRAEDLLRATLLTSANDAAIALAEKVAGNVGAFGARMSAVASRLGLADRPALHDPAGLDDRASVGGGNKVSARDLAIVARAALAQPRIASIVGARSQSIKGPDGQVRKLVNHNKLLATYAGLAGVKTGYTRKAGGCLMTAARRNGRTMVAVVLGVHDIYGSSRKLLDLGFKMKAKDEPRTDVLPRVVDVTGPVAPPAKPKAPARKPAPKRAPAPKPAARPARKVA